jgi:hypothetical protein
MKLPTCRTKEEALRGQRGTTNFRQKKAPAWPALCGVPHGRECDGGDKAPTQRPGTRQQTLPPSTCWDDAVVLTHAQKVLRPGVLLLMPLPRL